MGDVEKRLNKAAIKVAVTTPVWGTEENVGVAGCGILPLNAGVPKAAVQMIEDESDGAFESNLDVGNINPSDFGLDFDYRWDGLENVLLAMLMGTAAAPVPQEAPAAAAILHALSLKDSVVGIFGTYAVEKGAKIYVVPSFKVLKGTFSLSGGLIKAVFNLHGDRLIDDSTIIEAMTAVTYPANAHHRAKYSQAVFRMNAQVNGVAGTALADTDKIKPKYFTLEIERKMDAEHVASSTSIIEPLENDKPSVKLTMNFPRMDAVNDLYFAAWTAASEKKLDLIITGPVIAGTVAYYLKFEMPRLVIQDVEYADSKIIPAKIIMRAIVADVAPTGMTGLTLPVRVGLMNTRTTNLLA